METTVKKELITATKYLLVAVLIVAWVIHIKANIKDHEAWAEAVSVSNIVFSKRTLENTHTQPRFTLSPRQK